MEVVPGTVFYYTLITPFDISADPCSAWLDWHVHTLVNGNDVRVLRTRDPAIDPTKINDNLGREIGSRIQYVVNTQSPIKDRNDQIFDKSHEDRRSEPPSRDSEDHPVTIKSLRQELERYTNRVRGTIREVLNRQTPYDASNYRRVPATTRNKPHSLFTPGPPKMRPRPPTPTGNGNNLSISDDDVLVWLRNRVFIKKERDFNHTHL